MSAHGAVTTLNREFLGLLFYFIIILILCIHVHEKHKTFSCLGARCVRSGSSYGTKQGNFSYSLFVYIDFISYFSINS